MGEYKKRKSKFLIPTSFKRNRQPLPDQNVMNEIKELSSSSSNAVCCKYVKSEDLKYWSNRSEPVDFSQYDAMIANGYLNDDIFAQMETHNVAPYWINKFFLSRVNENDLNAERMKRLEDKQFVNEIAASLTECKAEKERPSYFDELTNILTTKQQQVKISLNDLNEQSDEDEDTQSVRYYGSSPSESDMILSCKKVKSGDEDEIYSRALFSTLDAEYDPFDDFEMDDFEYLDTELKATLDTKRSMMPSNGLLSTLLVDANINSNVSR